MRTSKALHPEDRDHYSAQQQQAVNQAQPYKISYRVRGADGNYHWWQEQGNPVWGEDGKVQDWIVSCTPQKQSASDLKVELEKEQEFLKALLANLAEGIVACDANGILTLFNCATQEFHGLPQESILPEQWAMHYDLYLPDGTAMRTEDIPLFRALNDETVRDVEMMIVPKQGVARTLLASGNAIFNVKGERLNR